jgi:oxygen-independent coproporphyrinogen-3 oxidase
MADALPMVSEGIVRRYAPAGAALGPGAEPRADHAFGPSDLAACLRAAAAVAPASPLALEIAVPFCWHRCAHCTCDVVVARDRARADAYLDRLGRELALVAAHLGARRTVGSVFVGGGTPTFLDDVQQDRLWRLWTAHFTPAADAPLTIAANPAVTSLPQVRHLRAVGYTHLVLGVHDLDDAVQAAIGRHQTFAQTRACLDLARGVGFGCVTLDLVFGLPKQTPRTWATTLERVVALQPDRVVCRPFDFDPVGRPNHQSLLQPTLPDAAATVDLQRQAWQALVAAGYRPVGLDHFVAPHDPLAEASARARDVFGYRPGDALERVGVGVGARTLLADAVAHNPVALAPWARSLDADALPTAGGRRLGPAERRRRALVERLACDLEVPLDAAELEAAGDALVDLVADGLCSVLPDRLIVEPAGRYFVGAIAALLHHVTAAPRAASPAGGPP